MANGYIRKKYTFNNSVVDEIKTPNFEALTGLKIYNSLMDDIIFVNPTNNKIVLHIDSSGFVRDYEGE